MSPWARALRVECKASNCPKTVTANRLGMLPVPDMCDHIKKPARGNRDTPQRASYPMRRLSEPTAPAKPSVTPRPGETGKKTQCVGQLPVCTMDAPEQLTPHLEEPCALEFSGVSILCTVIHQVVKHLSSSCLPLVCCVSSPSSLLSGAGT